MSSVLDVVLSSAFLAAVLRVATPYLLAAFGGLVAERAGISNIALEGQMLAAACTGALVAGYSGSVALGALGGLTVATLLGLLLAALRLELGADAIIAGIGLNLLASGATAYAVYTLLDDKGGTSGLRSGTLPTVPLPGIESVPVLGDALSGQNLVTWLAFLAAPFVAWLFYRTRFGFHLRAVGEKPDAAASVGIPVRRVQYAGLALSGALAGLAGVFLSMGHVSFFVRDMTAGRGFIALAAVFLGGLRPWGVFLAALGFGAAEALAVQLGTLDVPPQLVSTIPYAMTLLALALYAWRRKRRGTGEPVPASL
ncbi:ABC transporter permease [Streptomyces aurantiogriseus]|uniref:ABC transporter permease n=1 Tax=Streptomyces aurantiogriseus TaxID=66870 RepID=A0A918FQM4_9ACTN|nr:ABC transporter permease [Streptomyces aurantiogriseus]GGR62876.1 ABC transporter permease [Streptomyces aurantiogriseus]